MRWALDRSEQANAAGQSKKNWMGFSSCPLPMGEGEKQELYVASKLGTREDFTCRLSTAVRP